MVLKSPTALARKKAIRTVNGGTRKTTSSSLLSRTLSDPCNMCVTFAKAAETAIFEHITDGEACSSLANYCEEAKKSKVKWTTPISAEAREPSVDSTARTADEDVSLCCSLTQHTCDYHLIGPKMIESCLRDPSTTKRGRERAARSATTIQRVARGRLCRQHYQYQRQSAAKIQRAFRSYMKRKRRKKSETRFATVAQSYVRRYFYREDEMCVWDRKELAAKRRGARQQHQESSPSRNSTLSLNSYAAKKAVRYYNQVLCRKDSSTAASISDTSETDEDIPWDEAKDTIIKVRSARKKTRRTSSWAPPPMPPRKRPGTTPSKTRSGLPPVKKQEACSQTEAKNRRSTAATFSKQSSSKASLLLTHRMVALTLVSCLLMLLLTFLQTPPNGPMSVLLLVVEPLLFRYLNFAPNNAAASSSKRKLKCVPHEGHTKCSDPNFDAAPTNDG